MAITKLQQQQLKRFTLNAIAAAILSLHTEVASAIPCPTQIMGTALAGVICDFTSNASVTVKNGGEVQGIAMHSYNPPAGQIAIDAGGLISNPSMTAISILSSTLSNGLINNGTISTGTGSDIAISNSTIGDITNNGTIVSTGGTGLLITGQSTVNGNILNSGTITAGGVDDGIVITHNTQVNGNIINTGTINSGANGNAILI
jgi:hypothetical protein